MARPKPGDYRGLCLIPGGGNWDEVVGKRDEVDQKTKVARPPRLRRKVGQMHLPSEAQLNTHGNSFRAEG